MGNFDEATENATLAIKATPLNRSAGSDSLSNLRLSLRTHFQRADELADLNRAVQAADEAVEATPLNHPNRTSWLSNLGFVLARRFERTGELADLNRAIEASNEAVKTTPLDHSDRPDQLRNLGIWLGKRFERTGDLADLNRAIEASNEAVKATPLDHPDRPGRLSNLGLWLGRRYERRGGLTDLDRAVEVTNEAIKATPLDHPDRTVWLSNLGLWLGKRFERTGETVDLNGAVEAYNKAIKAAPLDHPARASCLGNLGLCFGRRFKRTGVIEDLEISLASLRQGWNVRSAPPSTRINLAYGAAYLLALRSEWEESNSYLRDAVLLLPTVSTRLLQHTDKQHMLRDFRGLASTAAAISLNAGKEAGEALEPLELGRGVIAGLLLELRTDISDLRSEYPRLADEFVSLRDELDSPTEETTLSTIDHIAFSQELRARRRREANQRFEELIREIRTRPRFHRFLLPPTVDELMAAAHQGPIVVLNISSYRCDAFLIEPDRIRVLSLPELNLEDLEEKLQGLRSGEGSSVPSDQIEATLEWLWNVVTRPVLEALGFQNPILDDNWPHIWWIPTGPLSHFPLHATGRHMAGGTETVLDRVMSSYSPSIKALVYGRQHSTRKSAYRTLDDALLVAMPYTPAHSDLSFAAWEVSKLRELCPLLQLNPIEPSQKNREDVLKHLRTCKIFHFAGHGRSDPVGPSQSCLLLDDWEKSLLTVAHLRDLKLQENSPFLGYLSACSTGTNSVEELTDESIHLVSAFQLAGFRHVVGTLWPVNDSCCVKVAMCLYETLQKEGMTDQAVCRGLHLAVRALRRDCIESGERRDGNLIVEDKDEDEAMRTLQANAQFWAPYIHFGG